MKRCRTRALVSTGWNCVAFGQHRMELCCFRLYSLFYISRWVRYWVYKIFGAEFLSSSLLSNNFKIKLYRTVTLPVVLYGCETWLLTLREERRLSI